MDRLALAAGAAALAAGGLWMWAGGVSDGGSGGFVLEPGASGTVYVNGTGGTGFYVVEMPWEGTSSSVVVTGPGGEAARAEVGSRVSVNYFDAAPGEHSVTVSNPGGSASHVRVRAGEVSEGAWAPGSLAAGGAAALGVAGYRAAAGGRRGGGQRFRAGARRRLPAPRHGPPASARAACGLPGPGPRTAAACARPPAQRVYSGTRAADALHETEREQGAERRGPASSEIPALYKAEREPGRMKSRMGQTVREYEALPQWRKDMLNAHLKGILD